jgi:hypothetical protein
MPGSALEAMGTEDSPQYFDAHMTNARLALACPIAYSYGLAPVAQRIEHLPSSIGACAENSNPRSGGRCIGETLKGLSRSHDNTEETPITSGDP